MLNKEITVLVVDQMLTMRRTVSRTLKDIGYKHVVEVPDGLTAWYVLQDNKNIRLVVSEWNLPKCSGIELLEKIRTSDDYKTLPFVLLTSECDAKQVIQAVKAGADSYITKPFSRDTLEKKLTEVYSRKKVS